MFQSSNYRSFVTHSLPGKQTLLLLIFRFDAHRFVIWNNSSWDMPIWFSYEINNDPAIAKLYGWSLSMGIVFDNFQERECDNLGRRYLFIRGVNNDMLLNAWIAIFTEWKVNNSISCSKKQLVSGAEECYGSWVGVGKHFGHTRNTTGKVLLFRHR